MTFKQISLTCEEMSYKSLLFYYHKTEDECTFCLNNFVMLCLSVCQPSRGRGEVHELFGLHSAIS